MLTIKSTASPLASPAAAANSSADPASAAGAVPAPRLLVLSQASAGSTLATDLPACSSVVHAVTAVLMPEVGTGKRRLRSSK